MYRLVEIARRPKAPVAQLSRFTALRAEAWVLLVEALREQDQEKVSLRRVDD